MHRIFVYGTLKRGKSNHGFLSGQRFLGEARTVAAYRLFLVRDYPGLGLGEGPGTSIQGELWEVDEVCLRQLDILEGLEEGLYTRQPVSLMPPWDKSGAEVYLYASPAEHLRDLGERFD